MVTKEMSEAAVEISNIFENMSLELNNKIPQSVKDFFEEISSKTYKFQYDKTKKLSEQNLSKKTKGIIAILYRDYICNEKEKEEYIREYNKILSKLEMDKQIKYAPNNIFKNKIKEEFSENKNENMQLLEYEEKESFIKKIFNKIKNFFRK